MLRWEEKTGDIKTQSIKKTKFIRNKTEKSHLSIDNGFSKISKKKITASRKLRFLKGKILADRKTLNNVLSFYNFLKMFCNKLDNHIINNLKEYKYIQKICVFIFIFILKQKSHM